MFNENHPNGTQYSGEAIENMPVTEAIPDENNVMRYKLVTLNRRNISYPFYFYRNEHSNHSMAIGATKSLTPSNP